MVPTLIFEDFRKQTLINKDLGPQTYGMSNSISKVEQWALELPLKRKLNGTAELVADMEV